jgi:hypothetical protein
MNDALATKKKFKTERKKDPTSPSPCMNFLGDENDLYYEA